MTFSLTVLGSSSALPTKNRFPTAHVLNVHERFFLIDCGEGTQIQLRRVGNVRMSRLNHIFISHLHGDHIFGLFGLISTFNLLGRTADLHVYAYGQLEHILVDHLKYFGDDMHYKVIVHPINTRKNEIVYEDHCMTVETIPLKHRIPTCGYLFREKMPQRNVYKHCIEKYSLSLADIAQVKYGNDIILSSGEIIANEELGYIPYLSRSYAFCSDTVYNPNIVNIIKGVDLLYHEATFLDEMSDMAKQTMHTTARQAAEIARQAEVKQLVIGHFSSRYKNVEPFLDEARITFGNTELAEEGKVFDIPLVRPDIQ
jgi:ribonuclease Z